MQYTSPFQHLAGSTTLALHCPGFAAGDHSIQKQHALYFQALITPDKACTGIGREHQQMGVCRTGISQKPLTGNMPDLASCLTADL